jgi:hypothetical protein
LAALPEPRRKLAAELLRRGVLACDPWLPAEAGGIEKKLFLLDMAITAQASTVHQG